MNDNNVVILQCFHSEKKDGLIFLSTLSPTNLSPWIALTLLQMDTSDAESVSSPDISWLIMLPSSVDLSSCVDNGL